MKVLLTLAYDGTNYCGWQIQPTSITVQGKIEQVLSKTFNRKIEILGASRTDSGVHAYDQKAVFELQPLIDRKIPVEKLPLILNRLLPSDIVVKKAELVSEDFHPICSAENKTYLYRINNSAFPNPLLHNYCFFVRRPLSIVHMEEACQYFIGTHNFKAFCSTGSNARSYIRTINSFTISKTDDTIELIVNGNGFLYNMVRIMVGTLIVVGTGKINPTFITNIIESQDRSNAGRTAPPNGLILQKINYPGM